LQTEGLQIKI